MNTIREEKISKKQVRQKMEETYGSEALAYADHIEERKRFLQSRVNRKPTLIAQSPLNSLGSKTLKGRTLQHYKNTIHDVEALDEWENEKKDLLNKQAEKDME